MKTTIVKTCQEVIEGDKITLENILIGGHSKTLDIINNKNVYSKDSLILEFDGGEYRMTINQDGVKHEMLVKRPEDKGGDYYQILQTVDNDDVPGLISVKDYWRNGSNNKNGYVPLNITFGSRKEDYKK